MKLLKNFIGTIPKVKKELQNWATMAKALPEPLKSQALMSIEYKAFHCIGGSVYAHYPGSKQEIMLPLIVAFQTISDYLDNLCDSMNISDPAAFRLLHQSIIHALTPSSQIIDYYELYPYSETTYLSQLVLSCQKLLAQIPYYNVHAQSFALRLADLYCELQVLKHITPGGEVLLKDWVTAKSKHTELAWNEWAAACGSTLGIFLLMATGFEKQNSKQEALLNAYFPWIQGLHILLDYLIDLKEDQRSGDLNFITFYPSLRIRNDSLVNFAVKCKSLSKKLPAPHFHLTVVDGLIALYGSDPKVCDQNQEEIIKQMAGDRRTLFMLNLCRGLRRIRVI